MLVNLNNGLFAHQGIPNNLAYYSFLQGYPHKDNDVSLSSYSSHGLHSVQLLTAELVVEDEIRAEDAVAAAAEEPALHLQHRLVGFVQLALQLPPLPAAAVASDGGDVAVEVVDGVVLVGLARLAALLLHLVVEVVDALSHQTHLLPLLTQLHQDIVQHTVLRWGTGLRLTIAEVSHPLPHELWVVVEEDGCKED